MPSLLPFLYGLSRSLLAHSNCLILLSNQVVGILVLDGARRRCLSWKLTVAQEIKIRLWHFVCATFRFDLCSDWVQMVSNGSKD
ncbi:hypothetical protein BKA64DRAFT_369627 [Cadophora sp. MPI-SDFR-AT-0126]|nr:hypothetical protein BKA64DRAFT_369627 [Leotiomycetes sp. MPI-SDFR-AT-0126]